MLVLSSSLDCGDQLLTPVSGSESETGGFSPRRLTEGNFNIRKVKKTNLDSLNGSFTSEDEPSACSSPRVPRRTFTGGNGDGSQDSPDVTPTGTLRSRRRSRLPSEEAEDSLLDFLRHGSIENEKNEARERRSWGSMDGYGSLDRSFGRRSRRKRPDLLGAEFLDRERPASPGPLSLPSPVLDPSSASESESRKVHQKIEAWLQSDVNKEQHEDKKSQHRPVIVNSEEPEIPNRSFLHTLHEDKLYHQETPKYLPIYGERWKTPAVNVEKVLEVVEGAQVKDKSAWRKSTLNVPNTTEPVDESARQKARRARSQSNVETSQVNSALRAAREATEGDTLRLYFRSTSTDKLATNHGSSRESSMEPLQQPRRNSSALENEIKVDSVSSKTQPLSRIRQGREDSSVTDSLHPIQESESEPPSESRQRTPQVSKITSSVRNRDSSADDINASGTNTSNIHHTPSGATVIRVDSGQPPRSTESPQTGRNAYTRPPPNDQDADSENIETPPTPRRIRRQPTKDEDLGDGNFDRFASIRRSRRMRKNADHGDALSIPKTDKIRLTTSESSKEQTHASLELDGNTVQVQDAENEHRDIDDAYRDIQKTSNDLKEEMERNSMDSRSTKDTSTFVDPGSRLNDKTEVEKVTGDYEKVTSRRTSRGPVPSLSMRTRSRPSSLPLSKSLGKEDGDLQETFTSTYVCSPSPSPERDVEKSPPSLDLIKGSSFKDNEPLRRAGSLREPLSRAQQRAEENKLNTKQTFYTEVEPDRDEGFEEIQSLTSDITVQPASFRSTPKEKLEEETTSVASKPEVERTKNKTLTNGTTSSIGGNKPRQSRNLSLNRNSTGTLTRKTSLVNPKNNGFGSFSAKNRSAGSNLSLKSSHSSLSGTPAAVPGRGKKPPSSSNLSVGGPDVKVVTAKNLTNSVEMSKTKGENQHKPVVTPFSGESTRIPHRTPSVPPQRQLSLRQAKSPIQSLSSNDKQPLSVVQQRGNSLQVPRRSESLRGRLPSMAKTRIAASSTLPTIQSGPTPSASSRSKTPVDRSSSSSSSSSSTHKENSLPRGKLTRSPAQSTSMMTNGIRQVPKTTNKSEGFGFMRATTSSVAKKSTGDHNSSLTAGSRPRVATSGKAG